MATTAVAPRRIDNCHAPCALTGCPVLQRTGLEPQEEVAPLSLSALLPSSLIFLLVS